MQFITQMYSHVLEKMTKICMKDNLIEESKALPPSTA